VSQADGPVDERPAALDDPPSGAELTGHPSAPSGADDPGLAAAAAGSSVEDLVADLERVAAERDRYLELAQRGQAEFDNFRKRVSKQLADDVARETGRLVESLLPVLDAFDYAAAHGEEAVLPLREQLLVQLGKEGLDRIDPTGEAFDPTEHDAVAHEPGDGGAPVVAETLRAGYRWQGRVLRPAMVRARD
jgi:molecular chaperone GrpE